jgi:queuine tRNA-ribosyltransferase
VVSSSQALGFTLEARAGSARAGILQVRGQRIATPCFMPVGTAATVKAMRPSDLAALDYPLILANTYHLALRPGSHVIAELGGLHRFMAFDGAILTDSGGYQVFSLAQRAQLSDDGVVFRSHLDGELLELTPESALGIQHQLGSDIHMVLDECPPYPATREQLERAVRRTSEWAKRSLDARADLPGAKSALFGIVQGGLDPALREQSARGLTGLPFDGFAVGGLSVGEPSNAMQEIARFTLGLLPDDKPRYTMGLGLPRDLLLAVASGADMFDCVVPTRHARNAQLFTRAGVVRMRNTRYRTDPRPPDPTCTCSTCAQFSRAYLRHLFLAGEILASMLATHHNLAFFRELMREARLAIVHGTLDELIAKRLPESAADEPED